MAAFKIAIVGGHRPEQNQARTAPRKMTLEIQQAVEALQDALLLADKIDEALAAASSIAERDRCREQRAEIRATLRTRRADLEFLLLGGEVT